MIRFEYYNLLIGLFLECEVRNTIENWEAVLKMRTSRNIRIGR